MRTMRREKNNRENSKIYDELNDLLPSPVELRRIVYLKIYKNGRKALYPGNKRERELMRKTFHKFLTKTKFPKGASYRKDSNIYYNIVKELYIQSQINRINVEMLYREYQALDLKYRMLRQKTHIIDVAFFFYYLFQIIANIVLRKKKEINLNQLADLKALLVIKMEEVKECEVILKKYRDIKKIKKTHQVYNPKKHKQ